MKLFEYMAHGRPIVASDLPAIREIVRPDVDAILCDPDEPDQWVATVDRLASDPALRARLGTAALEVVRNDHQWTGRADRILASDRAQTAVA